MAPRQIAAPSTGDTRTAGARQPPRGQTVTTAGARRRAESREAAYWPPSHGSPLALPGFAAFFDFAGASIAGATAAGAAGAGCADGCAWPASSIGGGTAPLPAPPTASP